MKYELRIEGNAMSVFDVLDVLVSEEPTAINQTKTTAPFGEQTVSFGENGKLYGRVEVETEAELNETTIKELEAQFPGNKFGVIKL